LSNDAQPTGHNSNTPSGDDWHAEYTYAISQVKYHSGQKTKWLDIAIDQLIIGKEIDRSKISARLKKDLEGENISDELIQKRCALKGCTDHESVGNQYITVKEGGETYIANTDGKDDFDSWRTPTTPSSNNTALNSSSAAATVSALPDYALQNKPYIDHLQTKVDLLQEVIKKLKKNSFYYDADTGKPNFTAEDLTEMQEYMQLSDQLTMLAAQAFDDRNTIPTPTQIHLCELVVQTSIKHATGVYIAKVKQLFGLSSKQVTKTLKGVIRDVHFLYEPTTRDEALLDGFYGKQCKTCQSWRVRYDFGGTVHCYHCESEYHVDAELLNQESKEPAASEQ
jgi:hypothetical protein